jgi:hypothetical protein
LREEGKLAPSETIVALLTGHLLKDPEYTMRSHSQQLEDVLTGGHILGRLANAPIAIEQRLEAIAGFLYDFWVSDGGYRWWGCCAIGISRSSAPEKLARR